MSLARQSIKEPNTEQELESIYPPPSGTTVNPLNSTHAVDLQKRMAWGPASRNALLDFKVVNGLTADDEWDDLTERTLKAEQAVRANETFVGEWAEELVDCKPSPLWRLAPSDQRPPG
jgi:hypothetical protein